MKNKKFRAFVNCNCKIPMNLQLFAEGGNDQGTADPPAGGGSNDPAPDTDHADPPTDPPKQQSFDDFLKSGGNQAEFDRRVQKAIDTALNKAKESWEAMTDSKISEAEKLAKMTAAEKAQYQEQQRIKDLDAREAAITRKELMVTAKITIIYLSI